ncbi:hypothetical protein [Sinorhizobium meliloti]|uniref:hypothetical protein n=1 Tax=Rhizobium meliloti TaxID=382 RepID=UPI0018659EE4|nr:hypothetical protein [Sinorhizobium meliloti]
MTDRPAIKPLEWRGSAAYSPIGDYSIDKDFDEEMTGSPWVCWWMDDNLGHFQTLDEAKAAAQSDFASRIRSCLIDKPEAVEATSPQSNLLSELRELVDRAQAIISTSTYPNWHASAEAALAANTTAAPESSAARAPLTGPSTRAHSEIETDDR